MSEPILELDPADPRKAEINPLLKLALELGPLLVFFIANARGEWLVQKFPALGEFGGPIFIATGLLCRGCLPARCRTCRWFPAPSSSSSAR